MKTNPTFKLFKPSTLGLAIVIAWGLSVRPAQATYIVTLEQVGSNVVATGSGAIDLSGLIFQFDVSPSSSVLVPNIGQIFTGQPGSPADFYTGLTGPTTFGSGSATFTSSGSGDFVGIIGDFRSVETLIIVPGGYVSGVLSDSATYNNATFSSLGVTPGTYVWTWGTGPDQKFTLKIGAAGVSDSGSTFGLLFLASTSLFGANRLRFFRLA
jgi:hypothetical protein